jgi:hypothetical protein
MVFGCTPLSEGQAKRPLTLNTLVARPFLAVLCINFQDSISTTALDVTMNIAIQLNRILRAPLLVK